MKYTELPPPPALADLIHCFWFLSGYPSDAETQPVVADGRLEIILHLAEPFQARDAEAGWRPQASALVAGQLTTPVRIRPTGASDVVGIRFRTDAAHTLLTIPLNTLGDRIVPLAELAPALTSDLMRALERTRAPTQRVEAMAAVLNRHRRGVIDPAARSVLTQLDHPCAPAIAVVADRLGLTARTIERRVKAATGLSPVELRAVLRFRRCYRLLEVAPVGSWGRVALGAGYYDQAHCIREFRRYTGAAPTEWFSRDTKLADAFLTGKLEG